MNKKLQVFVSSTFTDLREERQAAVEAILSAHHIPAGMELFNAGDEEQMKVIRRWIDESDVYVLILGGRYGSVEKESGKSYTQLEFEYAVETKKPFFSLCMAKEYLDKKIERYKLDVIEQERPAELAQFKKVVRSRLCSDFGDLKDLKLALILSLNEHAKNESLSGWVPGRQAVNPKPLIDEIELLRAENANLQKQLSAIPVTSSKPMLIHEQLTNEAKELLETVSNDAQGALLFEEAGDYQMVSANRRDFIRDASLEDRLIWEAAAEELVRHGLVKHITGHLYRLTAVGMQVNKDVLKGKYG